MKLWTKLLITSAILWILYISTLKLFVNDNGSRAYGSLVDQCSTSQSSSFVRIFVAHVPEQYTWDRYFKRHAVDTEKTVPLDKPFGEPVSKDGIIWSTSQYSAFWWFHLHILNSKLLVATWEDADVVYVPIFTNYLITGEAETFEVVQKFYSETESLLPGVGKKPHIILMNLNNKDSVIWFDAQFNRACQNFTFLGIEISKDYTGSNLSLSRFHSVTLPYPSFIHLPKNCQRGHVNGLDSFPAPIRHYLGDKEDDLTEYLQAGRNLTVSCAFSPLKAWREVLLKHCHARPKSCAYKKVDRSQPQTMYPTREWMALTRASWFCLQPSGDTYSRKSLFDCLLQLSIPVVFDAFWLESFPFSDILDPRTFIADLSAEVVDIQGGMNVVDLLERKYSVDQRLDMLTQIWRYRHVFQYSLEPNLGELKIGSAWGIECEDDALTQSLKAVVRNGCRRGLIPAARCCRNPSDHL